MKTFYGENNSSVYVEYTKEERAEFFKLYPEYKKNCLRFNTVNNGGDSRCDENCYLRPALSGGDEDILKIGEEVFKLYSCKYHGYVYEKIKGGEIAMWPDNCCTNCGRDKNGYKNPDYPSLCEECEKLFTEK